MNGNVVNVHIRSNKGQTFSTATVEKIPTNNVENPSNNSRIGIVTQQHFTKEKLKIILLDH